MRSLQIAWIVSFLQTAAVLAIGSPSDHDTTLLHAIHTSDGRELGLDQYIALPQIAVMGNTSSGKSSLLSALSGITFPSSHELATRCPTQLVLQQASTFVGHVRLHRYHANHSEHEGVIASVDDVPHAITRLTKLLMDEGQYTRDAIILELHGPTLPDLTLTDLPGLVRAVGDQEDKSIIPGSVQ